MTLDTESPEWPQADHESLVLYGVYQGMLKRWDVARATVALSKFMEAFGLADVRDNRIHQERMTTRTGSGTTTPWRAGRY